VGYGNLVTILVHTSIKNGRNPSHLADVGAHVKVNKSEQRPVGGAIIIIAGGGFGFDIIAA
jgi:hypothetical protein